MKEELCQYPECQRFYKSHDRLMRKFTTFKQQQELNWASLQSFRTLCSKVTEELQKQYSDQQIIGSSIEDNRYIFNVKIPEAIYKLEKVESYLFSIEGLMEKIFDINVSKNVETKFKEIS